MQQQAFQQQPQIVNNNFCPAMQPAPQFVQQVQLPAQFVQKAQHLLARPSPHSAMARLQLHFACDKLRNMDALSKSDPYVQVFVRAAEDSASSSSSRGVRGSSRGGGDGGGGAVSVALTGWQLVGETEIVWDNLSPQFETAVAVDFHFEEQQVVMLRVLDADEVREEAKGWDDRVLDIVSATENPRRERCALLHIDRFRLTTLENLPQVVTARRAQR